MAALHSYELNGKKLSFANWISNLSPTETPFCSMTGKEAATQTEFFWQTDRLAPATENAVMEGADLEKSAETTVHPSTTVVGNFTQILRRNFKVSDTANVLANYGRGREVAYQMEKFSLALKRDLEAILLSNQAASNNTVQNLRKTAGFQALVGGSTQSADSDTGAVTWVKSGTNDLPTITGLQKMSYNLYLANSDANVIMFHPKHAHFFASLQGSGDTTKLLDGDETVFSAYVNTYIDEYGREFKLVPNRHMPTNVIYFFKPEDFTQMVLRAPQKVELAKQGNYQHWMVEMEVGLRLRDPYAAGVMELKA